MIHLNDEIQAAVSQLDSTVVTITNDEVAELRLERNELRAAVDGVLAYAVDVEARLRVRLTALRSAMGKYGG